MKIAVIGSGLAGIEAAAAARKAGAHTVTLYSREALLPYMRPRLPEVAFGHGDISKIVLHPAEWYAERGISLRLDTPVTSVDVGERIVQTPDGEESFDALIFANGGSPLKPVIKGAAASPAVYTLWSASSALKINRHIKRIRSLAIIGGGILGVEAAIRAKKAGLKVLLIERQPRLMAGQLDDASAAAVRHTIEEMGIKVCVNTAVESAEQIASKLCMKLSAQEKTVDVDMILLSVGARAAVTLAKASGLTVDRGICVDESLQTSCPLVYAAGDCVQYGAFSRFSVRNAMVQGRVAGLNAVAAVKGTAPISCPSENYPLLFKSGDIEIHAWGQTSASCVSATTIRLDKGDDPRIAQVEVKRSDGVTVGLQMVGTGTNFDNMVKKAKSR